MTGKIVYPQVEQFVRFSDQHRKNLLLVIVAISYRYTIAVHLNIYSAKTISKTGVKCCPQFGKTLCVLNS